MIFQKCENSFFNHKRQKNNVSCILYRPSGFSSILIHLLHITIKNNHIVLELRNPFFYKLYIIGPSQIYINISIALLGIICNKKAGVQPIGRTEKLYSRFA